MKSKVITTWATLALLLCTIGCSTPRTSHREASFSPAKPNIAKDQYAGVEVDLVVEAAAEQLRCGQVDDAKKLIDAALAIEPDNRNAQYYSSIVEECIWKRDNLPRKALVRPWYPTLPPRPVEQ